MRTFLVGAMLLLAGGCQPRREPETPGPAPHVRVMTYNTNYGIAGDPATMDAIASGDADIVLLQETNEAWETALRARFGEEYEHIDFRHCCLAGGLGFLSRAPLAEAEYLERVDWFPAWRLVFDTSLGKLQVLTVHLRPQLSESGSAISGYFSTPPIREAEITRFAAELEPDLPTLVVGDFNETSGGRAIAYLAERGFRSGLSEFQGSSTPTWRWPTSVGELSMELDHVVYDPRLRPLDVRVLRAGNSDHHPVLAVFELAR